jgi:hypothetical protein
MESNGPRIVLDLDEVTLVDVEVVRFLGRCEKAGTALLHCPLYIREWIAREQQIHRTKQTTTATKERMKHEQQT